MADTVARGSLEIDEHVSAVRRLEPYYSSKRNEPSLGEQFFKPCLAACRRYRRAVGYFSSSALTAWATILPALATRDVTIRLLMSPELSAADRAALAAIADAEGRARIYDALCDLIVGEALDFARSPDDQQLRMRLLSWLVVSGRLELRFAFPEHVEEPGIFHTKIGLFDFPWGDVVAFTGSANESISGYLRNIEDIDVYRSWVAEDVQRIPPKEDLFQRAWEGSPDSGVVTRSLSPATLELIRVRAAEHERVQDARSKAVDQRWRHQEEAIAKFLTAERGVLEMATGTGKTRTALAIARSLVEQGSIDTIVVATDGNDLLRQWYRELLGVSQTLARRFRVYRHFDSFAESGRYLLAPAQGILLSSRQALPLALRRLASLESLGRRTLLVHDEVHRLGSDSNRQELAGLSDSVRFRLGLSATPERQYDQDGTRFITDHVGPVIFTFRLEDAIRRGVLCPFDYLPLPYELTDEDRQRLQAVYKHQAARAAVGSPMTQEEVWIELARVHKTSEAKIPPFAALLGRNRGLLERCIVFVETAEYGRKVTEVIHRFNHRFHTYYSGEDQETLRKFASGELDCLVTCHRLSEGIDIRSVRNVVLFSSARSRLETIQRIGRCLRSDPLAPGKRASIVDFVRSDGASDPMGNADQARAVWLDEIANVRPETGGE